MSSILICSTPVHGHVTPLLAVARQLIANGHRVRFLTGARYRGHVEASGADYLPLPTTADYDDQDMDASFPGRVGLKGPAGIRYDIATIFLRPVPDQLTAMDAAIAAEPVDAVLTEPMFIGSAALLTRNDPSRPAIIVLGIIPLVLTSRDTAPFGLGVPPMPGPIGRARNRLLRTVAERFVFGSVQREAEQLIQQASGKPLRTFIMNTPSIVDAYVQFTVPAFEYPRSDLPSTVHFVGPVSRLTASEAPLPDWWPELDGSRPVVHVTQGTVANKDWSELVHPSITALADEDVLVVVSTGGRDLSTLPPLPANVRAATYLPYDQLLPLTDVYVSNGGYGGLHYAMEHGVPVVVAGATEDKIEVTARVGWSGIGVNLKTNAPKADAIAAAVRRVLADPSYRQASARIGADIAASPGITGLEDVIAQVTSVRSRTR